MTVVCWILSELVHDVQVEGSSSPVLAGSKYSMTCTVTFDLPPLVKWLDPLNNEVNGSDVSMTTITIEEWNTTTVVLQFDPLKTSHGGVYTCVSLISQPYLYKEVVKTLTVQSKSTYSIIALASCNTS